jgi:RING finger protein 121
MSASAAAAAAAPEHDALAHAREPEWKAILLSYALIMWLFGAQLAIVYWKKAHPNQYRLATLVGLMVLPPLMAAALHNWRFLACCVVFTAQAMYTVFLATRKPMDPNTPQFIFRFFLVMHRITFGMGVVGAFAFVFIAFFLSPMLDMAFPILLTDAVLLAFYGGYFGCVQRDLAQVISDQISRAIAPALQLTKHNACALCGHELRTLDALEIGKPEPSQPERKIWKLTCTHEFHEECIRGWSVVGKRSMCPKCGEKVVDTNAILASSPWEKTSGLWLEFMDVLRMSLVWNPLIFMTVRVVFFVVTGN